MTREEAIHILEIELKAERFVRKCFDEPIHNARTEALNMAIETLKVYNRMKMLECDECGDDTFRCVSCGKRYDGAVFALRGEHHD